MFKKLLFTSLLAISTLAQGVIVDIQTFVKQMSYGTTQTVYLLGDVHRESPLNQEHMFRIFKLADTLGTKSTAFIIEDAFAQLNTDVGEHVCSQAALPAYQTTYLSGLSFLSKRCNFETTNVEFRAQPVLLSPIATFLTSNTVHDDCYTYASKALETEMRMLSRYNDTPETNHFYKKAYTDAEGELKAFSNFLTTATKVEAVDYFSTRPAILQLFDAKIMHAIHNCTKKNIIVCAGSAHIARIANLLKANHYTPKIHARNSTIGKSALLLHDYELIHNTKHPDYFTIGFDLITQVDEAIDPEGAVQKDITDTLRAITIFGHDKAAELRLMPKPLAMARL